MRVPLLGETKNHPSIICNNQKSINWYPVESEGGVSQFGMIGSPGTSLFGSATVVGETRGFIKYKDECYAVVGNTLQKIGSTGTATNLGTVSGSGRVGIATGSDWIVISTGAGNAGYMYDGTTFSQISDANFPGGDTVSFLDNFFIFSSTDNDQFFVTDLTSTTGFGPTQIFTADQVATNIRKGDKTLNMVPDHGELFAFGEDGIDVWYNSGNVDFPFDRNDSAAIERGCKAKWSIVADDNTLFFLGNDLIVYRMNGYTPARISEVGVETALSGYSDSNLKGAYAFIYTDHGHKFYQITIPNEETWVYDVATSLWHNKKRFDLSTHHAFDYMHCYGKHLILDSRGNGQVHEMSRSYYDDNGITLRSERRTQFVTNSDTRIRWKKLKVVMETGVGLPTGQGSDPILMLRTSDDRGRTFKNEKQIKFGEGGQYKKQVIKRHLGSSRVRQFELAVSDPVPRNIADVYVVAE
jgi:hypothetical protein